MKYKFIYMYYNTYITFKTNIKFESREVTSLFILLAFQYILVLAFHYILKKK